MSPPTEGGGRGVLFIFMRCGDTINPRVWSARKLRIAVRYRSSVELLAASDVVSSATYIQHLLAELTYLHEIMMIFDSRSLQKYLHATHVQAEAIKKYIFGCYSGTCFATKNTPYGMVTWV